MLLWILAGCALGTLTGLFPGLHVNTVAAFAVVAFPNADINIVSFLVAVAIVHTFVDFVPQVFIGAPNENSGHILPGHRFFLEGRADYAIRLNIMGALTGAIFAIVLIPLFWIVISKYYPAISDTFPAILVGVLILMVISEGKSKTNAIILILLSGALGIFSLKIISSQNAILAIISGLFGMGGILYSLASENKIIKQKFGNFEFDSSEVARASAIGAVSGAFVAVAPAIGGESAAMISKKIFGRINMREHLIMTGAIGTCNALFCFFMIYLAGKGRSGASMAVMQMMQIDYFSLLAIAAVILISAGIGALIAERCALDFAKIITRVNYKFANIAVGAILLAMVGLFCGAMGLLVFGAASAIGLFAAASGINRSSAMAVLIFPVLVYYFGF